MLSFGLLRRYRTAVQHHTIRSTVLAGLPPIYIYIKKINTDINNGPAILTGLHFYIANHHS